MYFDLFLLVKILIVGNNQVWILKGHSHAVLIVHFKNKNKYVLSSMNTHK